MSITVILKFFYYNVVDLRIIFLSIDTLCSTFFKSNIYELNKILDPNLFHSL